MKANGSNPTRLLIVDDEPFIRRALSDYLTECGYVTEMAANGVEGLEQALTQSFDVVLVDLRMPLMDGLQVIDTLKIEKPDLPVVVVSGTGVLRDVVEAMRRGAWDYVTKPIHDMDEITFILDRVLERARLIAERDRYERDLVDLNRTLQAEVARQTEYLRAQNRELTVLNHVISTAATTFDAARILHVLCAELALAFDLAQVSAALLDPEGATGRIVAEYVIPGRAEALGEALPEDWPVMALVNRSQRSLLMADPASDPRMAQCVHEPRYRSLTSILFVPLLAREQVVGLLELGDTRGRSYVQSDLDLIHNAAAAASQALETVRLHHELEHYAETLEATVSQRTHELQDALKQARAADEAKSQFLSSVSHELRTPLTSIRLYLNLLATGKAENHPRYIQSLTRETERLQTLIEGLLLISRLDLGRAQVRMRPVDLNDLLRVLAEDRLRLFADRGLRLEVDLAAGMPKLRADPKLIEQVATNLLTNAMNYTPSGGEVTLSTAWITEKDGRSWGTFSIRDTGPGISAEEQAHLFQRFFRGAAGLSSNAPGTGLGLAICREIVELHQGRITLDSESGAGAVFTVWLPNDSQGTACLG